MGKKDYYDVLGVKRDATEAQIKSAYRKLARKYHPDVNKAADASDRFKEATEAYETLSDPPKRKIYDQFGHAGPNAGFGGGAPGGGRAYTWTGAAAPGGGVPIDFEEMFGRGGQGGGFMGMSLEDIMAALGGGRPGRRRGREAARAPVGTDLEYELTLDFQQAVQGTTASLQMNRGGRVETLHVKIPPGVKEGSRIRVRGKGGEGPGGAGDLYIVTHVRPHPYFQRQDNDVYVELPISITEACLGARVDVPTVDGMTTVTVPPGTGSARKLRLRGRGVAAPGGLRGDQYVVIKIVPPPQVSPKGSELLRQFDQTDRYDPRADVPWK